MSSANLDVADSGQLTLGISLSEPDRDGDIRNDASKTVLLTTQLTFATSIGAISFLLFCFLRTRWNAMYAPRSRLKRLAPIPLPNTFFGWIAPLFKIPQSEVLDLVGLDATVLLAFYRMSYKLFAFCGIFALVLSSPLKIYKFLPNIGKNGDDNLFDGNSIDPTDPDDPDKNPSESSEVLFTHVIFTWVFSLATYYLAFYNYREFLDVRYRYYIKWKDTITARTVMVSVIPKSLQSDHALTEFYNSLNLGPVESATVYRQVRKLRHAIEMRAKYLRKLESAYVEYLGNPCEDPNYNPDLAIQVFNKALEEDPSTANKKTAEVLNKVNAKRPTIRTGFLGLYGKKVDKIDHYTNLFIEYDQLVKRGRLGAYVSTSAGFVTFKNITSAQLAAQVLLRPEPFQCSTELAPEPRDVFWPKLNIRKREMLSRDVVVNCLVTLIVFTWTIPAVFFASLLKLKSLKEVFPWLAELAEKNKVLKGIIQGTLPTLAVVTLNAMIPQTLTFLSKLQGLNSRSAIEYSTFTKYFFFLLFNILLIFTVAGTVFDVLTDLINNPTGITLLLARNLPRAAPFFINYIILQGIGLYPFRILMFKEIAMTYFLRVFLASTPREFADSSTPQVIDYGQELPPVVLIFVLVLVYSSLNPIILLFGTIFFLFGYICYKYLLLYVYFHPYETAGLAWPRIFRRIIIGLYIFQLLMIGYMSLKKSFYLAVALMPLLVITGVYYYYVYEAYNRSSDFVPLDILRENQEESSINPSDVSFKPKSQDSKTVTSDTTNDNSERSTDNTSSNNNENDIKEQGYSQRDILEDDLYVAVPDSYTDYIQPPMTLYYGILNTGMRGYTPPALTGTLPWLWLPVKSIDKNNDGGFIRRLLGMNNKTLVSGPEVDSTIDSIPTERDRQAKTTGLSSSLSGQSTSYGAVGTTEQFTSEPEQVIVSSEVPSTSFAANHQDTASKRRSRASIMADKIGEFAGSNFS